MLLPLLLTVLRTLGDAPTRSLAALSQRLGVTVQEATAVVTPLGEEATPAVASASAPESPLLPMTVQNGASSAPKTRLHRRTVIAARKKTIR